MIQRSRLARLYEAFHEEALTPSSEWSTFIHRAGRDNPSNREGLMKLSRKYENMASELKQRAEVGGANSQEEFQGQINAIEFILGAIDMGQNLLTDYGKVNDDVLAWKNSL